MATCATVTVLGAATPTTCTSSCSTNENVCINNNTYMCMSGCLVATGVFCGSQPGGSSGAGYITSGSMTSSTSVLTGMHRGVGGVQRVDLVRLRKLDVAAHRRQFPDVRVWKRWCNNIVNTDDIVEHHNRGYGSEYFPVSGSRGCADWGIHSSQGKG